MKRFLAFLMTVALVAAFAAPVVSAEEVLTTGTSQTTEYRFGDYANNGELLTNCAKALWTSYTANTLNWRYEAASNTYQFRSADKHPDVKGTGQNKIIADSIQFFGAENWWYALRLKSPGAGMYDVTLTTGMVANASGATIALYFLDAEEIDKALGAEAGAYAETMSNDPYLAGSTDAFNAFKTVIGGMLETATPVLETDFVDEKLVFRPEARGEAAFTSDSEMVMVAKYVSKDSLKLKLKSLSVTKTAELPEELRKSEPAEETDVTPYIAIGVVAVVGIAVAVVAVSRKKKKAE